MKHFLLLILFSCVLVSASAQVVHVKGIQSVEAGYGRSLYGQNIYVGYVKYFGSRVYGKATVYHWTHEDRGTKAQSIGADFTANYTFIRSGEKFYLNAVGGLGGVVDQLSTPLTIYDSQGKAASENYSSLKFGVLGGIEAEYMITYKFVFVVGGNQRLLFGKKELGNQRWLGYAGIRFNF